MLVPMDGDGQGVGSDGVTAEGMDIEDEVLADVLADGAPEAAQPQRVPNHLSPPGRQQHLQQGVVADGPRQQHSTEVHHLVAAAAGAAAAAPVECASVQWQQQQQVAMLQSQQRQQCVLAVAGAAAAAAGAPDAGGIAA